MLTSSTSTKRDLNLLDTFLTQFFLYFKVQGFYLKAILNRKGKAGSGVT